MSTTIRLPSKIEGYSVPHLLKTAKDAVERKTQYSVVLDYSAEARIPKFHESELTIGRVLGRGGFCVVSDISKIKCDDNAIREEETQEQQKQQQQQQEQQKQQQQEMDTGDSHNSSQFMDPFAHHNSSSKLSMDEDQIHNIVQDRPFMQKFCVRKGKDTRYAIKRLQESTFKDPQTFVNGVVDLAIEARFLSVIRHPNVIKMRAMRCGSPFNGQFFVILDRLYDILTQRLVKWNRQQIVGMRKILDRGHKKETAFWVERVTVAYDLACALKYLHDLNIVYRDIKPDNIGFDVRGDVKIFDFGLAKEIDRKAAIDGAYKLTGDTGSPRYMAPEVALNQPYNETCDVFSFCILLWQMLKLMTPYEGYTMSMFEKKVVRGGSRPRPDDKWPKELVDMMGRGWGDWKGRPYMEDVCNVLRDELNRHLDEEIIDGVMDASRKSEMSLRQGSSSMGGSR